MSRCKVCRKKNITNMKCKCGKTFCIAHLGAHDCNFDYKKEHKDKLKKENPQIVNKFFDKLVSNEEG